MAKTSGTTAETLHQEDVVAILTRQHARIREEFIVVKAATGDERRTAFAHLRALLVAHETAEEMVLRPVSVQTAGAEIAAARNAEEKAATQMLAQLDDLDPTTPDFEGPFRVFQQVVQEHAANEENDEFPLVQKGRSAAELASMGQVLLAVEKIAPTHPHPATAGSESLQWAIGPLASVLDRARDALNSATGR